MVCRTCYSSGSPKKCLICDEPVTRAVGVSGPMNIPEAESLNYKLPIITITMSDHEHAPFRSVNEK